MSSKEKQDCQSVTLPAEYYIQQQVRFFSFFKLSFGFPGKEALYKRAILIILRKNRDKMRIVMTRIISDNDLSLPVSVFSRTNKEV